MRRTAPVAMTVLLLLTACSGGGRQATPTSTASTRNRTTHADEVCASPTQFGASGAPHEIHGTSTNASVWGLALGPGRVPPRAGEELKIVWRMTGDGPLAVTVTAPDGRHEPLVFGPEEHGASSYHRPGDEWGTGIRFTSPGCWHVHLARDDVTGDAWLEVSA